MYNPKNNINISSRQSYLAEWYPQCFLCAWKTFLLLEFLSDKLTREAKVKYLRIVDLFSMIFASESNLSIKKKSYGR